MSKRMKIIVAAGCGLVSLAVILRATGVLAPQRLASTAHTLPLRQAEVFKRREENHLEQPSSAVARMQFDAAALMAEHPPRFSHPNKKTVYRIACPEGSVHTGTLVFSRWEEMRLPQRLPASASTVFEARPDIYSYDTADVRANDREWHVNFADTNLFFGCGTGLFAQDEIQVAEHPALGALREALRARRVECSTTQNGRPTPVLITGAERRCAIALAGLYGNRFASASEAAITKAVRALQPPPVSNIIAMAAPAGGSGTYTAEEIEYILATAYTAFRAAKRESPGKEITIHTGFWGCGAFGGCRGLMIVLQLCAARLAGADKIVIHTYNDAGMRHYQKALKMLSELTASECTVEALIGKLQAIGFQWGESDGN